MLTDNMLLTVFFVSGVLAFNCPQDSHLFITVPQMEALSGSCLQIPCNFSHKPEHLNNGNYVGIWNIVDAQNKPSIVVFSSKNPVNSYPMNITGKLNEKDCTTLFSSLFINYTNNYYFRIESSAYKASAVCDPLQIKVTDSPPSPRIEISGDLKEKESVTISCSAPTPCPHSPPKLTWNLTQDPHNNITENRDRTFTTKIQKTITLSDTHDGLTISCSATYPVNEGRGVKTAEERKTLSVSYAPKNTSVSISPSGLVSAGSWVNLTCSSRAKPPPSFSWFKNSKDGALRVAEGNFYSFKVTNVTDDVYYCAATNDLGTQRSSEIHLTNEDPPKDVKVVISPTDPVSVGSVVNLTCSYGGNPPTVNFVWFMISDGRLELIKADTQLYGFKVTNSDQGRSYYCGSRNDLGIQLSTGFQLIFEGEQVGVEVILKILGVIMLVGTLVIFECWFRTRRYAEPRKDTGEAVYVNRAVVLHPP